MTTQELLVEIEAFLARREVQMTESTFGRLAVNDGKFVTRLREGGGLTLATVDKVRAFIRGYAPPKPAHIPNQKQQAAA
jgi:hypothetical protein